MQSVPWLRVPAPAVLRLRAPVEAVFQGPEEALDAMLVLCRRGPPGCAVTGVETIGEGVGAFAGFEVRPTA